jgi:tRNA (mo5U34)-methyltransferase
MSDTTAGTTGEDSMALKEKRVSLGSLQFAVSMESRQADRLRRTVPYRRVVLPALGWLERRAAGGNCHALAEPSFEPPPPSAPDSPEAREILDRVQTVEWYHAIDLPHGVSTPGYVDHRGQVSLYGLPEDMRGMRALDVATYDGFWALEMEKRGADVTAIDLESLEQCDYPRRFRHHARSGGEVRKTGAAFDLARELLGSRVERRLMSVYDLSPEAVGTFDVVFLSDLLLHLRDPALAIENVASVTRESGFAIVAEPFNERLEQFEDPISQFGFEQAVGWWQLSAKTLRTMMWAAGFDRIDEVSRFRLVCKASVPLIKVVLKGYPAREVA